MDRRSFLLGSAAAGAALSAVPAAADVPKKYQGGASPWPMCLNTSTIRPTSLKDKVRLAGETGYDALELWMNDLEDHEASGGDVEALGREIRDRGMFVIDVIGLWDCMPEPIEAFQASLELTKKRMRLAEKVGSRHVAVLPLPDRVPFDLAYATDRYRDLLEIGLNEFNIQPAFEFVSVFKGVRRLGQAAHAALDANHPKAMIIPDTFHLHNGGSGFDGIRHLRADFIASFHWNDVPANPPPGNMADGDRIHPGDGVLPLVPLMKDLLHIGYTGPISLEMFNKEHWASDPKVVLETGLRKMKEQAVTAQA